MRIRTIYSMQGTRTVPVKRILRDEGPELQ